jgi:hypothetical protein
MATGRDSTAMVVDGAPAPSVRPARGLRAAMSLDLDTAARAFPAGRFVIPLVVVAGALGIGWLRPGYASIYGESLAVIVVLVAFGSFGRAFGALTVLLYGAVDIAHFLIISDPTIGAQANLGTFVGRVVAAGVLGLVVVAVPSSARLAERMIEGRLAHAAGRYIGATGAGVAVAIGTYLWANLMPYLIRPAFRYSPPPVTLQPQQHPEALAVAAGIAYLAVTVLLRRRSVDPSEAGPLLGRVPSGPAGLTVRVIAYGAVIIFLSGILGGALDVGILVAGFAAGEVGAWLVGRSGVCWPLPGPAGSFLTIAAGFVAMLGVGSLGGSIWPNGLPESPFFPIILATSITFPIVRMGFAIGTRRGAAAGAIPMASSVIWILAILGLLALAMPPAALADNCAGLGDCSFRQLLIGTLMAYAAFFTALADSLRKGPPPPEEPPPPLPEEPGAVDEEDMALASEAPKEEAKAPELTEPHAAPEYQTGEYPRSSPAAAARERMSENCSAHCCSKSSASA